MKSLVGLLIVIVPLLVAGQEVLGDDNPKPDSSRSRYDEDLLSMTFHMGRRQALRDSLPPRSVAVLFSNPVRNRSNDVNYEYHQAPDFYYLTGLLEPHAMLLVFKEQQDFDSIKTNEILFVQASNPTMETWDGRRLGVDGAIKNLGFNTVLEGHQFADFYIDFAIYDTILFLHPGRDIRDDARERGDLYSLFKHFESKTDRLRTKKDMHALPEILAGMRQVKQPQELTLLMNAIDYTCEGQRELMKALEPGMKEYQAEAIVEYIFKKNGAEQPGFPSICGGGENSCILHYTSNRKRLEVGDLLVVDIGAEYHGYSADVTRTMPVSGKFTDEQKIIYDIVLKAQEAGIKACIKGNKFWDPNVAAKQVLQQGLRQLGITEYLNDVNTYFMHGASHYLGLDVHDVGLYNSLQPGVVITVEPGIYIPEGSDCDPKWWNIGIRIEDDVLITDGVPEVLSASAPKTVEEIEKLMTEDSPFTQSKSK